MRIGVDATCWSNRRGYGRFARDLLTALLKLDTPHRFTLFVDAQTAARGDFPTDCEIVIAPTSEAPTQAASATGHRTLSDTFKMSRAVRQRPPDILLFPSVYTYFPVTTRTKMILGVHDVIAEDHPRLVFPQWRNRFLWRLKSRLARLQAHAVMTVSDFAKRGITRHFRLEPATVFVVEEAPDPVFRPLPDDALDRELLAAQGVREGDRFIVYLGGVNPHKNLAALVRVLGSLRQEPSFSDVSALIVGDTEGDVFTPGHPTLKRTVEELGLSRAVRFTGFLPDEAVVSILCAAKALVLPSLAEGFGLPAVEAAACGTPVVATVNSPLPDLLAGGGFFVDPNDEGAMADALRLLLSDEGRRRALGAAARDRAVKLTWERSARQALAMLETVGQGH